MTTMPAPVAHRTVETDGVEIFYREAGQADAPVVLLPHGYPCSSFEFGAARPRLPEFLGRVHA
jgi:pimeloyl-ACP methyl ester carboxylesterase